MSLAQTDRFTVTELCVPFNISREKAYEYLGRYAADGLKALAARRRQPHRFPQHTADAIEKRIMAERRLHGTGHAFRALMRQTDLPEVIRVDLGTPFASVGLGQLSALSVWRIEQSIKVEFTRPAAPKDRSSHEWISTAT